MIDDDHTMKNGDCPARYIEYSEGSLKKQLEIVDFARKKEGFSRQVMEI
jgi:hypothetical protein